MGRFESNTLAPRHRHHPPRDSRNLDGRLSGSLAAFKLATCVRFKNNQIRFFSERFRTPPDSFISKNEGMAKVSTKGCTSEIGSGQALAAVPALPPRHGHTPQ